MASSHEQGGGDLQEPGGQERAIWQGKCVDNTSGTKVWVLIIRTGLEESQEEGIKQA